MSTAASTSSLTILVTEDDPLIRSSLRRFFEKSGHAVLEASSVAEARAVLWGSRPDAAVFDYQLPDGDGLALLKALRNVDPTVPAVVLTAVAASVAASAPPSSEAGRMISSTPAATSRRFDKQSVCPPRSKKATVARGMPISPAVLVRISCRVSRAGWVATEEVKASIRLSSTA